jgi:predicted oxidoreductase
MERIAFPGGVAFSRLVYGMWRLGDDPDASPVRVRAKIDACLAQGITTFDQADIYGDYRSEALFGAALDADPGLRDRIEVVTKCDIAPVSAKFPARRVKHYDTSPAHIRASVEASLRAMATDRIDMILLHRPDPLMDADATGAALDALVAGGKVRAVGVSNFRPWDWDLLQSRMTTPLATNQIELSLLARDAFVAGDLAHLQRLRVPPMAWSPLAGGGLFDPANPAYDRLTPRLRALAEVAGVAPEAVAAAWLLAHPARILPVLGTNNLDRIGRISDCLRVEIDRETWFELWTLAEGREVP